MLVMFVPLLTFDRLSFRFRQYVSIIIVKFYLGVPSFGVPH